MITSLPLLRFVDVKFHFICFMRHKAHKYLTTNTIRLWWKGVSQQVVTLAHSSEILHLQIFHQIKNVVVIRLQFLHKIKSLLNLNESFGIRCALYDVKMFANASTTMNTMYLNEKSVRNRRGSIVILYILSICFEIIWSKFMKDFSSLWFDLRKRVERWM